MGHNSNEPSLLYSTDGTLKTKSYGGSIMRTLRLSRDYLKFNQTGANFNKSKLCPSACQRIGVIF